MFLDQTEGLNDTIVQIARKIEECHEWIVFKYDFTIIMQVS